MDADADVVDRAGRHVWVVTWGRPGRVDWKAVLVLAYDPDEAVAAARGAFPELRPPDAAVLAAPATARAALAGEAGANLPIVGS